MIVYNYNSGSSYLLLLLLDVMTILINHCCYITNISSTILNKDISMDIRSIIFSNSYT